MMRLKKWFARYINFVKENPRYGAVAGVFLLAVYYHLAIALPADSADDTKKQDDETVILKSSTDIDSDHPSKTYERTLLSRKGDWYRIGLVSQSLDEDAELKVSFVSSVGKRQEIGLMEIKKDDGEKYFEFVVSSDDSYENVLVERVVNSNGNEAWSGGEVRLADMSVSRLDIADAGSAKSLRPTVFGKVDVENILMSGPDVKSKINLPRNVHFLQGQVLEAIEHDEHLLSANVRVNQNGASGTGKYRLELRSYNPKTKKIDNQVLQKTSFSIKDLKNLSDSDGSYRISIPFALKSGQSYFLGISDDYVKSARKIQLDSFDSDGGDPSVSRYFSLSVVRDVSMQGEKMMARSVIEDLGSKLQYRYLSNHTVTDMMDVYESSDKISFDDSLGVVVGKESLGTFFTYKIDTKQPFDGFRVQAVQLGDNDDKKIRVEYSFDNTSWKEVPATGGDTSEKVYDLTLHNADKNISAVYVKVSYVGSKDGTGVFGLSDFHVTATIPKDVARKLSR